MIRRCAIAAAMLLAAGCYDAPYGEPDEGAQPPRHTETIATLRKRYPGKTLLLEGDIIVEGVVTSSDEGRNFYRSFCIEEEGAGIEIMAGIDQLHNDYPVGCRVSLSVGVVSQAIALVIGFLAGVCAGYFGGKVDAVISFVIQVFSSFPFLLFAIVVMYALGPGLVNLYVALGLLGWASTARLVRGDVMRLKGSEYIQSCILSGGKSWRIIMKHLLPNCVSTLIVTTTLGIPSAIMSEASLSFLGLGVQPPMSSWGQMINAAQPYIQSSTYYSVIPGIAIIITVMAFNLLGDALRDALDPKMRS